MELFFEVGITANHPVKRFVLPNLAGRLFQFVDFVRGKGLYRMQQFNERPEHRLAFLVLLLDLRFKEKVNVIRHDASSVESITVSFMPKKKAL